jgi:hypothetical protein
MSHSTEIVLVLGGSMDRSIPTSYGQTGELYDISPEVGTH